MFKKLIAGIFIVAACVVAAWSSADTSVKASLTYGNPEIQSLGVLAFGPENLLLIGDSKSASVFAVDVNDATKAADNEPVDVQGIDIKIAAMLGVSSGDVQINDMAVHPASQNVYLSVTRGQNDDFALLRVNKSGEIEEVSLEGVHFSKASVSNAPAMDAKDRRGRSLRTSSITDIGYADGHVYVAGLSNEEFASNLRQLPFPFEEKMHANSLEIFHVAHGRYETHAPVRTFMPYSIEGEAQILAAYTCTPLVAFPVNDLKDGAHVKGKTVAELGAGNSPLDIVSVEQNGKRFVLIANTNRTMMLIDAAELIGAESLTEPLEGFGSAGVPYTALPLVGVMQLDILNDDHFVILQRQTSDGSIRLRSYATGRFG